MRSTVSSNSCVDAALGADRAVLGKALAEATGSGVESDGIARSGRLSYQAILEFACNRGCDLIFMASHGCKGIKGLNLDSQTQMVITHSTLPVHVVSVESNNVTTAGQRAISIIKDEHRAIAGVCNGLRRVAEDAKFGAGLDLGLLSAILHYLKAFPEVLHHPKEERYLFAKLACRTDELADVIADLEVDHQQQAALLAELESRVSSAVIDGVWGVQLVQLGATIDRFVDLQWRHLNTEEMLILPAAQAHLTDEDWVEIEQAFRENPNPEVDSECDLAFRKPCSRAMDRSVVDCSAER